VSVYFGAHAHVRVRARSNTYVIEFPSLVGPSHVGLSKDESGSASATLSTVTTAASRDRTCTTRLCTRAELGEMLVVARNLLHRRSPPAHDPWPITPALRHDVKCAQITLRSPRWVLRGVAPLGFTSTCQDRPRMHKHVCTRWVVLLLLIDR
jgi:hypothetical protein